AWPRAHPVLSSVEGVSWGCRCVVRNQADRVADHTCGPGGSVLGSAHVQIHGPEAIRSTVVCRAGVAGRDVDPGIQPVAVESWTATYRALDPALSGTTRSRGPVVMGRSPITVRNWS